MNTNERSIGEKAEILIDALPYIRNYSNKIIVLEYGCAEWLTGMEEKQLMQDIVLLKSIGMKPIVVHDTRMGMDKFRENKRIAKLLELCGCKAIGICGIDIATLRLTMDNDYIPVIVPNDIDNEMEKIDPMDTALEIAAGFQAEKLIYLCNYPGIFTDETRKSVYPILTVENLEKMKADRGFPKEFESEINHCIDAVESGVERAHILDGRIEHVLPIELFSPEGAGTVVIKDESYLYGHEVKSFQRKKKKGIK